jgi:hypothetical protein
VIDVGFRLGDLTLSFAAATDYYGVAKIRSYRPAGSLYPPFHARRRVTRYGGDAFRLNREQHRIVGCCPFVTTFAGPKPYSPLRLRVERGYRRCRVAYQTHAVTLGLASKFNAVSFARVGPRRRIGTGNVEEDRHHAQGGTGFVRQ